MGFSAAQPGHGGEGEAPKPATPTPRTRSGGERELVIVKDGQRHVFTCTPGGEQDLLHRLGEMSRDPECSLTPFDVAVLTHQLGHRLKTQLQRMHPAR